MGCAYKAKRPQGLDYTYTLEGWLKGINYSELGAGYDPGHDGTGGTAGVGQDVFGMVLNYYRGDFTRAGSPFNSVSNSLNLPSPSSPYLLGGGDLFNGNITSWMQQVQGIAGLSLLPSAPLFEQEVGYTYRYDQLNRITQSRFWDYVPPAGFTPGMWQRSLGTPYDELFSYDKNGNLQTLSRFAQTTTAGPIYMDQLHYTYNTDGAGNNINRLNNIFDAQGTHTGVGDVGNTNYGYDAIGELDLETSPLYAENRFLKIAWTPYGKVDNIRVMTAAGSLQVQHQYLYDGMGNQVQDVATTPAGVTTTYHIYDGHNVQLAKYQLQTPSGGADNMGVLERYLYGSDKLGTLSGTNSVMGISYSSGYTHWWVWGPASKEYEIHDHLGNVRATVSSAGPNSMGMVSLLNYYNYYAFGSYQPQRTYEPGGEYSFGFNGKEKKDDWRGAGNSYDYGMRDYDTRIGRFFRVDPLTSKYPELTPYQFASNKPIQATDLDGLEARLYNDLSIPVGHTFLSVIDANGVINVYSYGQYAEGRAPGKGQSPMGTGVLVHLMGDAANEYIRHEFENGVIAVYELSNKVADKDKLMEYYSQLMAHQQDATSDHYETNLARENKANGSKAVEYGTYEGIPSSAPCISENCTTSVLNALHETSSTMLPYFGGRIPPTLMIAIRWAARFSSEYKDVTVDARNKANDNKNGSKKYPKQHEAKNHTKGSEKKHTGQLYNGAGWHG